LAAAIGLAIAAAALFGGWIPAISIAGHFGLYAALGGSALAIAAFLLRQARAAAVLLPVAVLNALIVVAPAWRTPAPGEGARTTKLMVFNIRWSNKRLDDVTALVSKHQPDVVVLQEVFRPNRERLRALDAQFPYRVECWQSGTCDTLILSRKQLRDPFVVTEWNGVEIGFVRVEFDAGDCPVTLFASHLNRPWPYRSLASDGAQFRQAQALAQAVKEWSGPKVVAGDFNATTWSPVVRTLAAAADGRALSGWSGTWPYFLPGVLKLPIDHVIVSRPQISATREVLETTGSDHSPVLATLAAECGR
jgi:endonuclease/exonuclease/phosphatase (EEP) superfamily protein YafD